MYGTVFGPGGSVMKSGLVIKLICVTGSIQRFVGDLGIKVRQKIV